MRPPAPWHCTSHREGAGDVVILLHGLWRSYLSMEELAKDLNSRGFETLNISYASFRDNIPELIEKIDVELRGIDEGKTIHFVTHSMGGVLARYYVASYPERSYGRAVMLAPPHRGSQVVDWLEGTPFLRVLGPAGASLSTRAMKVEEVKTAEGLDVLVLMGEKSRVPFFRFLLDMDNDGIVSVSSGVLAKHWMYRVVDADHTLIMVQDETIAQVREFLCAEAVEE